MFGLGSGYKIHDEGDGFVIKNTTTGDTVMFSDWGAAYGNEVYDYYASICLSDDEHNLHPRVREARVRIFGLLAVASLAALGGDEEKFHECFQRATLGMKLLREAIEVKLKADKDSTTY